MRAWSSSETDRRSQSLTDRLPLRVSAQIVVAARPRRLGHQLQLAGGGRELEHRQACKIALQRQRLPVGPASLDVLEGTLEQAQVSSRSKGTMSIPSVSSSEPL